MYLVQLGEDLPENKNWIQHPFKIMNQPAWSTALQFDKSLQADQSVLRFAENCWIEPAQYILSLQFTISKVYQV